MSAIKLLALFGKCYFFVGIKMSKNIHNLQTGIKKRHELSVIKPLLKHLNINLETVTNSERPDFIIMHENRKIGLELKENADIQEYWLAVAIFAKEPFEFWNAPYTIPCDIGYSRIFLIQYDGIRELNY